MELSSFIKIALPVSLAFIMLSMGMTLVFDDFARIWRAPKSIAVGLSAQILFVPLIAVSLLLFIDLPPVMAAGLMILSFCPGGTTSNLFSYLSRANVALSISLTAVASLITPFTIPFLSSLTVQNLLGENAGVSIPIGLTMFRLVIITILPVTIGMVLKARFPVAVSHWQPWVNRGAVSVFVTVIGAIVFQQWAQLPDLVAQGGVIVMLMILCAMAVGYAVSKVAGMDDPDKRTITIEVGLQNGGMALVVTQTVLHNAAMSVMPVLYGLLMLIPVTIFAFLSRFYAREQQTVSAL